MSMMTSDTSVTFSLAELAKIEAERVREEEAQRTRSREKLARERREAEARILQAQATEAEARARRAREEADKTLRTEARDRAAIEVARIEAEARVRLTADNAVRAQELAVLRARTEGRHQNLVYGLAAALGLVLFGGAATAYGVSQHVARAELSAAQLREGQQALGREREHAKATDLAGLDRRHAALRARTPSGEAAEARLAVEAARNAVDTKALESDRLRTFGDALDALETRLDGMEKVVVLDQRRADLTAWATSLRRAELTTAARTMAARAKASCTEPAVLRMYAAALDQLREALAQPTATAVATRPVMTRPPPTTHVCMQGDPSCGLDGKPIF